MSEERKNSFVGVLPAGKSRLALSINSLIDLQLISRSVFYQ